MDAKPAETRTETEDQMVERMVYWTDGQNDLSLCEAMPGESDEAAIARGEQILAREGGEMGDGQIVVGPYAE